MKMTEEQIIDLIARPEHPVIGVPGVELVQHYASTLAAVSGKLNKDEMAELVAFGSVFYQLGVGVWKEKLDRPALFAALQKLREEQDKQ